MSNSSTIEGTAFSPGAALDLDHCVVWGYLVNVSGFPLRGAQFTVRHIYTPIGVYPSTIVNQERIVVKADHLGYVEFPLLRNAVVRVELPNRILDHVLTCTVPSTTSVPLGDFLFPRVTSVTFSETSPITLGIGETVSFNMRANLSNGTSVVLAPTSTTLVSSNTGVLGGPDGFTFLGTSAGTATVSISEFDQSALGLLEQPDGASIVMTSLPDPTLTATVTVQVS